MLKIVGSTKDYKVGDEMLVCKCNQFAKGRVMQLGATLEDYLKQAKEDDLQVPKLAYHPDSKFYYIALD